MVLTHESTRKIIKNLKPDRVNLKETYLKCEVIKWKDQTRSTIQKKIFITKK